MRRISVAGALAGALWLAACGGGGVQAPDAVAGAWGRDCSQPPQVTFAGGSITVSVYKATFALKSATLAGGQLTVAYDTPQGAVSEVYVLDGQTLRLDHGTYAGTDATWHVGAMNKCS